MQHHNARDPESRHHVPIDEAGTFISDWPPHRARPGRVFGRQYHPGLSQTNCLNCMKNSLPNHFSYIKSIVTRLLDKKVDIIYTFVVNNEDSGV